MTLDEVIEARKSTNSDDIFCVETIYDKKYFGLIEITNCDPECCNVRYNFYKVFLKTYHGEYKIWSQGIRLSEIEAIKVIYKFKENL